MWVLVSAIGGRMDLSGKLLLLGGGLRDLSGRRAFLGGE